MIKIRAIHPDEAEAFVATATQDENLQDIQAYLTRLLTIGSTRLDWCFVAEDNGQLVGRVAYWMLPNTETPTDIVLLDLPWQGDYLAIGAQLLQETHQLLRDQGAVDISHVLDLPARVPQWQHFPDERHNLLTHVGFAPLRETLRFRCEPGTSVIPVPDRLTFRGLDIEGDEKFIETIIRVSSDTFDQQITDEVAELGPREAALDLFKGVGKIGFDPSWWQLAYDSSGELVGFVMPAGRPDWGTIGYIGVVPEQRGHGYIDDLLARGTTILVAAGTERIETDTDVANFPMANAFRRAGYIEFGRRRDYKWRQDR